MFLYIFESDEKAQTINSQTVSKYCCLMQDDILMDMMEDNMDKVGESMKNIVKSGYRNTFVFSFVPKHTELKRFPNSELIGTNLTFYTGSNFGLGWVMGLVPLGKGYGKNIITFLFFWKIMIRDFITIHNFNESIIFTILSWYHDVGFSILQVVWALQPN